MRLGYWNGLFLALLMACQGGYAAEPRPAKGEEKMIPLKSVHLQFEETMGKRVDANIEHWLLRMPDANPGVIDMFHRRDRQLPYPQVVPWAGEFAGKYLISAVQALDMTNDPRLEPAVREFVNKLIASQAEDGYLGPFTKKERLLSHWDLWGHYHCMLGLLMWYDRTGDERAMNCVLRAADLMCTIYVGTERRPVQAGAPETNNLAVMHVLANLYRRTGNPRYLELVRVIEEDMTTVGDWLRQGEAGVPFHLLNGQGSRWESLHIVQGLAEMYRVTGEERYKKAVLTAWDSIRRYDRHPSGAFSTFERAAGSVYAGGQLETCCSVGWTALTLDVLELTGSPLAADELELTTWNQALGSQHPSGNWCTYDTPLNGVRAPSYHQINFQYRPSAPELNCCSVNGPRQYGLLRSWAVMEEPGEMPGVVVNYYGPGTVTFTRSNGNPLTITQETRYPVEGVVKLHVAPKKKETFTLRLRIPAWSTTTAVRINGKDWPEKVAPGTYLTVTRAWKKGDCVELAFDMSPRSWTGAGIRTGRSVFYAGPLLLAYDTYNNATELPDLAPLDASAFRAELLPVEEKGVLAPMGLWKTKTTSGAEIVLTDFASVGAHGTEYASWLPTVNAMPPKVTLEAPSNGAEGGSGPIAFEWAYFGPAKGWTYELTVAKDPELRDVVLHQENLTSAFYLVSDSLLPEGRYYWNVRSVNAAGTATDEEGPWTFTIEQGKAPLSMYVAPKADGPLVASALDGCGLPTAGLAPKEGGSIRSVADRFGAPNKAVEFWWYWSLATMRYRISAFPEKDYTFTAWINPAKEGPRGGGDLWLFSAWCADKDDPLRIVITRQNEIVALIETSKATYKIPAVPVEKGTWVHLAVVKGGKTLTLYLNGKPRGTVAVPEIIESESNAIGLSSNPAAPSHADRYVGGMDDFAFYGRALSKEEVETLAK